MLLRNTIFFSTFLTAAAALAAPGDPCDSTNFDRTCSGDVMSFCPSAGDNPNIEIAINCPDGLFTDAEGNGIEFPGVTCSELPCTGAECGETTDCLQGTNGGDCIGILPLLTDEIPDDFAFSILCTSGQSCVLGANADGAAEACAPRVGGVCTTPGESSCEGNVARICLGNQAGTVIINDPVAIDCTAFGVDCVVDAEGAFCDFGSEEPTPAEGEGEGEGEGESGGRRDDEAPEGAAAGALCNAQGHGRDAAPFGALALLAIGVVLRRRR